jgi:probable blue pigment (indigoidine) exporter
VIAVILGWLVLGQYLSPAQFLGMAVVLGSVWLSQRAQVAGLATGAVAAR